LRQRGHAREPGVVLISEYLTGHLALAADAVDVPVVVVLSLATLFACWWPARDAMRTDPLALLREE
jgi:ABC-type lipoprotein release transport system permease subunit